MNTKHEKISKLTDEMTAAIEAAGWTFRADGESIKRTSNCGKCGGSGYGNWRPDGGRCYACGGVGRFTEGKALLTPVTKHVRKPIVEWALDLVDPGRITARHEADRNAVTYERKRRIRVAIANGALTDADLTALRMMRGTDFGRSLRRAVIEYGCLTEGQSVAIIQAAARKAEATARRATDEAAAIAAPTGRVTIDGTIVSVKFKETMYGDCYKCLVRVATDEGVFKVWMTATDKLIEMIPSIEHGTWSDRAMSLRGRAVRCAVTLKPSNDDKSFAFGSRPAKFEMRVTASDFGDIVQ